jgi:hypothetical protein
MMVPHQRPPQMKLAYAHRRRPPWWLSQVTAVMLAVMSDWVACLQDIGEELVSLLHYQERGQLVAITSGGSAVILSREDGGSSSSRDNAAGSGAWSVLLRMKVSNAAAGSGMQVSPSR